MKMHIPINDKAVDLFRPEHVSSDTPLVLLPTGGEDPNAVWKETRRLSGQDFCLATLSVADWECELSHGEPRKCSAVVRTSVTVQTKRFGSWSV